MKRSCFITRSAESERKRRLRYLSRYWMNNLKDHPEGRFQYVVRSGCSLVRSRTSRSKVSIRVALGSYLMAKHKIFTTPIVHRRIHRHPHHAECIHDSVGARQVFQRRRGCCEERIAETLMSGIFEKKFQVGWRHVDPNGHVANMVYLEYAVDTRIAFFASQGFPPMNFVKHGFGPVIKSDLVEYFREAVMLDELRVTNENGGHSEDGSRFRVINNIYKVERRARGSCDDDRRMAESS